MRLLAKRLYSNRGFSLTELLATIIILVLASSLLATGVPSAIRAYQATVDVSNAQILLSTTTMALRDELQTASGASNTDDKKTITYTNNETGEVMRVSNGTEPVGITLAYSDGTTTFPGTTATSELLVSDKTATKNLYMTYATVTAPTDAAPYIEFTNLEVKNSESGNTLAHLDTFKIKPLEELM